MALSDDELDPDEVDLDSKKPYDWSKARKYWNEFLDIWEKEIYYPVFANRGIGKGHALTTYSLKIEIIDIYNLMVNIHKEETKDDDGDSWKPPKS